MKMIISAKWRDKNFTYIKKKKELRYKIKKNNKKEEGKLYLKLKSNKINKLR